MKNMRIQSFMLSPRSIFAILLLCSIALAQTAPVAPTIPIDSRMGSGSRSLALRWQHVKTTIPHYHIPTEPAKIKDVGSWGMEYVIGLVKVVGTGFAIAIGSLLAGLLYGSYKLVRHCCCPRPEGEEKSYNRIQIWCPTIVYIVAWVFLLTGVCIGVVNNPILSDGITDMGNELLSFGTSTVELGFGIIGGVENILQLIPASINEMIGQFAGIDPLADEVDVLAADINSTSAQVTLITSKIAAIDAGNTTAVAELYAKLSGINNSSQDIINHVSQLTSQVSDQLRNSYNSTVEILDSKIGDINATVGPIVQTAEGIMKTVIDLLTSMASMLGNVVSYDKMRAKGVTALFVLALLGTLGIIGGFVTKYKWIFNLTAAGCFINLFFFWFSGSIHFLLGMALSDICPVMDTALMAFLDPTSTPTLVLEGCMVGYTIFQSLQINYNMSAVLDYKTEFQQFANFSQEFNFSTVDDYFNSIQGLYSYNLTSVAMNLTVESYGWNQSIIYTTLDSLNNQTSPDYFGLDNYTSANPNSYPAPQNQTVYELQNAITALLDFNATIYNKTATAQQQLIDVQADIDSLLSNMDEYHTRFDNVQDQVVELETHNITRCVNIIDNLASNITAFLNTGHCEFAGLDYMEIKGSLCYTMQPAIDTLTVAHYLVGVALIPLAILAEVLSRRIPRCNRVTPCGNEGDTESGDGYNKGKGGYSVALTDSPAMIRNRKNMTATIGVAEQRREDSDNGTPDYNNNRRSGGVSVTYE